jgi:hypothetical protein
VAGEAQVGGKAMFSARVLAAVLASLLSCDTFILPIKCQSKTIGLWPLLG